MDSALRDERNQGFSQYVLLIRTKKENNCTEQNVKTKKFTSEKKGLDFFFQTPAGTFYPQLLMPQ